MLSCQSLYSSLIVEGIIETKANGQTRNRISIIKHIYYHGDLIIQYMHTYMKHINFIFHVTSLAHAYIL